MEAPSEIWLIGQAVSEEKIIKECWRHTTEAYLSYKLITEPSAQVRETADAFKCSWYTMIYYNKEMVGQRLFSYNSNANGTLPLNCQK